MTAGALSPAGGHYIFRGISGEAFELAPDNALNIEDTTSMTNELIFYTNPKSRGRIARWMLEETGVPYRTEVMEFGKGIKSPEYLALNPMGKVPTIRYGKTVVTECAAICAWLADTFPEAGLAPPPAERASYYRWMFFAAGPVEAAVTNKALGFSLPPERGIMAGYGSFENAIGTLEKAVSASPYIAGETFSAADVYVGSQIGWGLQFKTLEPRQAFIDYWNRLKDRPALTRANKLDDALIAA